MFLTSIILNAYLVGVLVAAYRFLPFFFAEPHMAINAGFGWPFILLTRLFRKLFAKRKPKNDGKEKTE